MLFRKNKRQIYETIARYKSKLVPNRSFEQLTRYRVLVSSHDLPRSNIPYTRETRRYKLKGQLVLQRLYVRKSIPRGINRSNSINARRPGPSLPPFIKALKDPQALVEEVVRD